MSKRILAHLTGADPILGGVIVAAGSYRLKPDVECQPFRALAHAIAHQQLNGTVANTILNRFIAGCGRGEFPTPQQVLKARVDKLRAAGFSFNALGDCSVFIIELALKVLKNACFYFWTLRDRVRVRRCLAPTHKIGTTWREIQPSDQAPT